MIFRRSDFNEELGLDVSRVPHGEITEYVKKAVAGIEVRSSAFLIDQYEAAMQERTARNTQLALEMRDRILNEFADLLDLDTRRHYIPILEAISAETLVATDFRVPSWRRVRDL